VRRSALRALEDAKSATEAAYLDAQSQHADKINELRSALMVCAWAFCVEAACSMTSQLPASLRLPGYLLCVSALCTGPRKR
jgi:hypothetical protein